MFPSLLDYKEPMQIWLKKMIDESGLAVQSAIALEEAADLVRNVFEKA